MKKTTRNPDQAKNKLLPKILTNTHYFSLKTHKFYQGIYEDSVDFSERLNEINMG
jgi:hypothetical protein